MKCIAIIPSGGIGSRFDSPIPKQFVKVLGKELIYYTLKTFQESPGIDEIIIPTHKSYFEVLQQIKEENNFSKISGIVKGGTERQDSVYNGLISRQFADEDLIVVHDAARPLLSQSLLEYSIESGKKYDSVVVAIKARDTLLEAEDKVIDYIDRSRVYYAQTPQIFRYSILYDAFKSAIKNNFYATDESMLVKNSGFNVKVVDGEYSNFKITTISDMKTFEKIIK